MALQLPAFMPAAVGGECAEKLFQIERHDAIALGYAAPLNFDPKLYATQAVRLQSITPKGDHSQGDWMSKGDQKGLQIFDVNCQYCNT